jgi:RadC-like JAB domain
MSRKESVPGFGYLFRSRARGAIDGASVHPRDAVKEALRRNAAAVILAHSEPRHRMSVSRRVHQNPVRRSPRWAV